MQNSAAADRIAALQRHLQAHHLDSELQLNETKASADPKERPAPGGGPGSLTVKDNRTGKTYEIEISDHGTIKGTDLKKITAGGDGAGIRPYDNGLVKAAGYADYQQCCQVSSLLCADMLIQLLSSLRSLTLTATRASCGTVGTPSSNWLSAPISVRYASHHCCLHACTKHNASCMQLLYVCSACKIHCCIDSIKHFLLNWSMSLASCKAQHQALPQCPNSISHYN